MRNELIPKVGSRNVAVVYHYFAHYRQPIVSELVHAGRHSYTFFGDTDNHGSGIELADEIPLTHFRRLKGYRLGSLFLQPGALRVALDPQHEVLILLGNSKWPTSWAAALLGRLSGKRVLMWTHGWTRKDPPSRAYLRNGFYRLAHGLLLYGERARKFGLAHGFSAGNLHIVFNSLDVQRQRVVRQCLTAEVLARTRKEVFPETSQLPILVNVCRHQPTKRLDLLIEAARILGVAGRPVNLLLIGDGPENETLRQQAAKAEINANFLGAIHDEFHLAKLIAVADLTVMPGPAGLLVLHSLAYGTPIVTHDDLDSQMPETEAIIPGKTGDFFARDDVESLVCAIERWLDKNGKAEAKTCADLLIESRYNPGYQLKVIERAIDGLDAQEPPPLE